MTIPPVSMPDDTASLPLLLSQPGVWWVLALDGRHARVLTRGSRQADFEEAERILDGPHGETIVPHESGHHHGRYEKTERQFVEHIAARLEEMAKAGAFDHLLVFAPPVALGVVREAAGRHTRDRLRRAEAKDIMGESLNEIRERLTRTA